MRGVGTTAGGVACFPLELGVEVKLQLSRMEVTFSPNGYIISGLDGVVYLLADLAEKTLELIPVIAAADENWAEAIKGGMSFRKHSRHTRANVLSEIFTRYILHIEEYGVVLRMDTVSLSSHTPDPN